MPFALVCRQFRFCFVLYFFLHLCYYYLLFKAASPWPYGLSGSRPLRDFLLVLILYASLENKFFFFFLLRARKDERKRADVQLDKLNEFIVQSDLCKSLCTADCCRTYSSTTFISHQVPQVQYTLCSTQQHKTRLINNTDPQRYTPENYSL